MNQDRNRVAMTFTITAIISLIVAGALWLLRDTDYRDVALLGAVLSIVIVFLGFVIYFGICSWKRSWWLPGLSGSVVVYFGVIMISLSHYVGNIISEIGVDPSISGFGLALIAIGLTILPRRGPRQLEEALAELMVHTSELGTKIEALSETYNSLEHLVSSVSDESQKFFDSVSKRLKKNGGK